MGWDGREGGERRGGLTAECSLRRVRGTQTAVSSALNGGRNNGPSHGACLLCSVVGKPFNCLLPRSSYSLWESVGGVYE